MGKMEIVLGKGSWWRRDMMGISRFVRGKRKEMNVRMLVKRLVKEMEK